LKSVFPAAIAPVSPATNHIGPVQASNIAGVTINPNFPNHRSVQNADFKNGCLLNHLPALLSSEIGLSNRLPAFVINHPSCFTLYASSPLVRICTLSNIVCFAIIVNDH
jgi:hypothetical protein